MERACQNEATIAGIDLDVDWQATDSLSFDLQLTWLHENEYDDFAAFDGVLAANFDFSGQDINRSPDFTGVFGTNLEQAVSDNVVLRVRAEVFKTSEIAYSFLYGNRPDGALNQDGYKSLSAAGFDSSWRWRNSY